jgi:predicted metal-dependent HD superfamily phosphohydrolase
MSSKNTDTTNDIADQSRFRCLWLRQQLPNIPDASPNVYQQLLDSYNEPQRVYHSIAHIECCLSIFDQVSHLLKIPDAVELAIWFHDAIYQLGASDNEQLSADLFMKVTDGLFQDDFREAVYQHIMATCHSSTQITDHDTQLMVDIDLSSFGLPWPEFFRDSKKVRQEMGHISDAEYYQKQIAFQQRLLGRPSFFYSDYFIEHYEAQARSNLAKLFELVKSNHLA